MAKSDFAYLDKIGHDKPKLPAMRKKKEPVDVVETFKANVEKARALAEQMKSDPANVKFEKNSWIRPTGNDELPYSVKFGYTAIPIPSGKRYFFVRDANQALEVLSFADKLLEDNGFVQRVRDAATRTPKGTTPAQVPKKRRKKAVAAD